MNIVKKVSALLNPRYLWLALDYRGWFNWLPDKIFLKMKYFCTTGKILHLDNPVRYNEKLQWIKLYDRRPEYSMMVDKYKVRDYVKSIIGEEYLIPLIGKWDSPEEINFDMLPEQFVLKCNHDSGSVIICKEKDKLDELKVKNKLKMHLRKGTYKYGREWPYKNVDPCIICEEYLKDQSKDELLDYKVMCFSGRAKLIQVHTGRFSNHMQDFYDINWKKRNIVQGTPNSKIVLEKPCFLEEMLCLSEKLAQDFPEVRVDWYFSENHLYFGELTFFDASGFDDFEPDQWNYILGNLIKLGYRRRKNVKHI